MYILLFKNSTINYIIHPYFFIRKMLEGKDYMFNKFNDYPHKYKAVEFMFRGVDENEYGSYDVSFSNYFFTVDVMDKLSGDYYMKVLNSYKDLYFDGISYICGHSIENYGGGFFEVYSIKDLVPDIFNVDWRIIENVHDDLEADEIDMSWLDSKAVLKKINKLPEEIVLTENGEEIQ